MPLKVLILHYEAQQYRERLMECLKSIAYLRPYPSRANFILCRVAGRDARELQQALEREGILVRYFNKPGLTDCLRISAGRLRFRLGRPLMRNGSVGL